MKIVFVYPAFESLGIEYLSAVLRTAGHETKLIYDPSLFNDTIRSYPFFSRLFSPNAACIAEEALSHEAGLIAFSVVTDTYSWASSVADIIKEKSDTPVVFGGIHPSSMPRDILLNPSVDFVVTGEGEEAMLELADALSQQRDFRKIPNLCGKIKNDIFINPVRPLINNLDSLPFPDKEIYRGIPTPFHGKYTIITSRGCPHSCSYCSSSFMTGLYHAKGRWRRRRSPENVIEELLQAKKQHKPGCILFFDEEFSIEGNWLSDFLPVYKEKIGLPFFCFANPKYLNKKIISLLDDAGCAEIEIGIQTTNEKLNREILNRHISLDNITNSINLLRETKILTRADFMFGLPHQTQKDMLDSAIFLNQNRVDIFPTPCWLRYYPKTEICRTAVDQGIFTHEQMKKFSETTAPIVIHGNSVNKAAVRIVHLYYLAVLLPKTLVKFIINLKFYRIFPGTQFRHFFFLMIFLKNRFISLFGKKRYQIFYCRIIKFYSYNILHFILRRTLKRLKPNP